MKAPASMNGPKGIFDLRPARRTAISAPPTTPPNRNPRNAPASDLGPAQPAQVQAEHAGQLDVAEAHAGGVGEGEEEVERIERGHAHRGTEQVVPVASRGRSEHRAGRQPTTYDGSTMASGSRLMSMSMSARATPTAPEVEECGQRRIDARSGASTAKTTAVRDLDQRVARADRLAAVTAPPRSNSQLTTGTLSRGRTGCPQPGQCDGRADHRLAPGTRQITTLRNDPTSRPSRAQASARRITGRP